MQYKIHSFLPLLFSLLASYAYAGGLLIMQCEFSDFFQDIKLSGAIGFKSDHSFAKKIHADTTMVGLIYHPLIGLHCGALPTSTNDDDKKKGIARRIWPFVLNGIRDKTIQNHQMMFKNASMNVEYPAKEDCDWNASVVDIADTVLRSYPNNRPLIQTTCNTIQQNAAQTVDKKQKEMLQQQAKKLAIYLEKSSHKGIS